MSRPHPPMAGPFGLSLPSPGTVTQRRDSESPSGLRPLPQRCSPCGNPDCPPPEALLILAAPPPSRVAASLRIDVPPVHHLSIRKPPCFSWYFIMRLSK